MKNITKYLLYILMILIIISGCTPRLYETKKTQELMGTFVEITVFSDDKDNAESAISESFEEISRIESLLSNYINTSEVYQLNMEKTLSNPSKELIDNMEKSLYYSSLSDGSFDITVQPILDLYTESFQTTHAPPTKEQISKTLKNIDYKNIRMDEQKISIENNQKITLGGLAKGYAIDKAIGILKKDGIEHALINAGGDMKALGKKYGSLEWNIALANPRDKEDYITIIALSDSSIVTSGDYERYFDENMSFHHIVDPKTGYSATELISVTIKAENAFDADALSTTVFVLGKEKGLELIESIDNTEGLIITKEKEIIKSSGFD